MRPPSPFSLLLAACAASTFLACAKHHVVDPVDGGRRDVGARPDVGDPGRDAGPDAPILDTGGRDVGDREGVYWRLERRPAAYLRVPNEAGCFTVEDGLAVVEVGIIIEHTCEYGGPLEVVLAPDNHFLVETHVWVQHPVEEERGCFGVAALETRTMQTIVASETYTVSEELSGQSVSFTIPERDGPPCAEGGPQGAACERNCDCQFGLLCVPALGDFAECFGGQCYRPCNIPSSDRPPVYSFDFDCEQNEECVDLGLARPVCRLRGDDCTTDECGPGTACHPGGIPNSCSWETELNGVTRHVCGSDADCEEPGTYCVQHATGERRCEVPCFTDRQRCPFMHLCDPETWICEWLGE